MWLWGSALFIFYFFIIRLPPEFLPVSGLLTWWCDSTLGAALLCSSKAGSWFRAWNSVTIYYLVYGFNLKMQSHRNQKRRDSNPGPPGKKPLLCHLSHRTSLGSALNSIIISIIHLQLQWNKTKTRFEFKLLSQCSRTYFSKFSHIRPGVLKASHTS